MKILKRREHKEIVSYYRVFDYEDSPGSGFSFDCDALGQVFISNECAEKNYQSCLTGKVNGKKVVDQGIEKIANWHSDPAIGECQCGEQVVLWGFTNACECGRDYNSAGQELADRSQWGEETGESLSDILAIK